MMWCVVSAPRFIPACSYRCGVYTGVQGATGATGSTGDRGRHGQQGEQGDIGFTGTPGLKGDLGFTGQAGSVGQPDVQGSRGMPGDTGRPGPDRNFGSPDRNIRPCCLLLANHLPSGPEQNIHLFISCYLLLLFFCFLIPCQKLTEFCNYWYAKSCENSMWTPYRFVRLTCQM